MCVLTDNFGFDPIDVPIPTRPPLMQIVYDELPYGKVMEEHDAIKQATMMQRRP